jgi:hypothetical protein
MYWKTGPPPKKSVGDENIDTNSLVKNQRFLK